MDERKYIFTNNDRNELFVLHSFYSDCLQLASQTLCRIGVERFLQRCSHCMQRVLATRKLSVCLSVRSSAKRVICDKMKEICANILIPHERPFILVSWQEEWLVGDNPFHPKFWVKLTLLERKRRFSIDIRS